MEKGVLIGRGRTAEIYAWGSDRILKLYNAHMPGSAAEREYAVTRAVAAAGFPAPAADRLVEMDGRFGVVMERLEGQSMLKLMLAQPAKMIFIARKLGELHAMMHGWLPISGLPGQREQIRRGIEAARHVDAGIRQPAFSILESLPEGNALCHGDFHPDNILMTSRGPVVIDWLTGTTGNAQADIFRTSLLIRTGGLPPGTTAMMGRAINTLRSVLVSMYRNRYLQIRSEARRRIDNWAVPMLTARLAELNDYPDERQVILAQIKTALNKRQGSSG